MDRTDLQKKIKIKGQNYSMKELILNLPLRYEKKVYLESFKDLDNENLYKFVFHKESIVKSKSKLMISGQVLDRTITVIHTVKLAPIFFSQNTFILCGKIERNSCFFPSLLKTLNTKNEIVPVYKNITNHCIKTLELIIEKLPKPCDSLFRSIHFPKTEKEISSSLDYLLQIELAIFFQILDNFQKKREPYKIYDIKSPFVLREDQAHLWENIKIDCQKDYRFVRVIHGDVGSGKTLIAYLLSNLVAKNKKKVAIMAPTGVLAEQIYNFFQNNNYENFKICLIVSETVKKTDINILRDSNIFIGTHALLYKNYFDDLGLLIIDEQHKFGVNQRNNLIKDKNTDILMLSATPIPRTYQMMTKGYISYSVLNNPLGSQKRNTVIVPDYKISEVVEKMKSISLEDKVIWVCKTIELAEKRFEEFSAFNSNVSLLHGQMKNKNIILSDFNDKPFGILISTTVIEVGIDIDLNFIFIEEADSFGFSQLHQMRGRVARREKDGFCILIGKNMVKLRKIKAADDGFLITELDNETRGSGKMHGIQQSGFSAFNFAKTVSSLKIVPITIEETTILKAKELKIPDEIIDIVGDYYEASI